MDLKVFWATLTRRWYLAVVALLFTVGTTLLVVNMVGPTYEAMGSVLVFPPVATVQRDTEIQAQGNPYLVLNGVGQARDIVIRTLTAKSTREELAEQDPGSSFEATPDFTNSAPIILFTVEANSSSAALSALAAVMDRVPTALNGLQSGLNLPADAVITSKPLIADAEPDVVHKGQIRAGIAAGVAALGLSILMIGLFDGLLAARRSTTRSSHRRARTALEDSEQGAQPIPAVRTEAPRRLGLRAAEPTKARRTATDESPHGSQQLAIMRLHSASAPPAEAAADTFKPHRAR
jgi:hypothetical protein